MENVKRLLVAPRDHYILLGPRGTGKSTWLETAHPGALKVDLLDAATFRIYQARPERLEELVSGNPDCGTVVVDEVQKVPELLDVVHRLMERYRGVRFALTGSSARKLRRTGTNLLGGRAVKLSMGPFMARELGVAFSLEEALRWGMLPVVLAAEDRDRRLAAYLDLYIREEIREEGVVRNLGAFTRFLEAASFSHAAQLSVAAVARDCGVPRTTVDGYLAILRDLLLAEVIPVFSRRARRRLVEHGKFYFFDTGVWRALRPKGPLDSPGEIDGAALEGLVYQHLRARLELDGVREGLHFWRTSNGTEVDFVVYTPDRFDAIEVKNSDRVHPEDLRGLHAFLRDYPEARATLLYRGRERLLVQGIHVIPVAGFLLGL